MYSITVWDQTFNELQEQPLNFKKFGSLVKTNAPLDFKNTIYKKYGRDGVKLGLWKYEVDVLGNMNYGFAGAAAGFSAKTLKFMGGLAQMDSDIGRYGKEQWGKKTNYDDPRDQEAIQAGIDLYNKYKLNINSKKIQEILRNYPNLKEFTTID